MEIYPASTFCVRPAERHLAGLTIPVSKACF
jgi:hypothetical protein